MSGGWVAAAGAAASSLWAEGQETLISSLAHQGLPPGPWECGVSETGYRGHGGWNQGSGGVQVTHTPYFALPCPSQTYSTATVPKKMGWHEGWAQEHVGGGV